MHFRDWATLLILALLFASSFLFTEVALSDMGPITVAAARLIIGGLVLTAVLYLNVPQVQMPTLAQMAVLGLLNSVVPITLIAWAQDQLSSSVAAILAATSPIFGAVLAHFFSKGERLTSLRIFGTVLAFVGVALIVDPSALLRLDLAAAPLAVLLAAMSSAAAGIIGKRILGDISAAAAATGQVVSAAIMATALSLVLERPWEQSLPSPSTIAALVAMGLLSTALAYRLFFHLLGRVGVANTMLVGFLVPIYATLLGVVFLHERLSILETIGLALVLVSLLTVNANLSKRESAA